MLVSIVDIYACCVLLLKSYVIYCTLYMYVFQQLLNLSSEVAVAVFMNFCQQYKQVSTYVIFCFFLSAL